MARIIAIDQGTSSSRAIAFDESGTKLATAQRAFPQYYPQPGWVDHDAREIWDSVVEVIQDVVLQAGLTASEIDCVGITNQRETTVIWDRATGEPLAPAMVWQSRQSAPVVEDIAKRGMISTFQIRTGLVPDAYFSATKIALLLDQDPELRAKAEAGEALFGTIDSWLVWKLTGGQVHRTDMTNASRTMLYDIRELAWSPELLADLQIPMAMMPEVLPSGSVFGDISTPSVLAGIPITGIAGDQHAALFGQGCFEVGQAKNTYGTGSFALMNVGTEAATSDHRLLSTIAWGLDSGVVYALEGAVFVTGSAVQWLRDGLGLIESASDVEALAASVQSADGVVFVPALAGLGAPVWDPGARGTIIGITRGTTSAHIARATLDGIAFQVADVLEAMASDSGSEITELRVDGGAAANDLLLQRQADILGVPVVRPVELETTALGAAYLAGLTAGIWPDQQVIAEHWREDRRFLPAGDSATLEDERTQWRKAVERAKAWA